MSAKQALMLGASVVSLTVVTLWSTAAAQFLPDKRSWCESYATQAVTDNEEKTRLGCRLFGPRWSSDYSGHFNWCLTAQRAPLDGEIRGRYEGLRLTKSFPGEVRLRIGSPYRGERQAGRAVDISCRG